ncbi:exostosin-like 1 isoform X2 [Dromaius novaehollandiae]|uniref:exostosin-like 1 isoform X2 n=1 Tax=Dromaius novaehollandiae TaxID=8790 RepID=UPI00311F1990
MQTGTKYLLLALLASCLLLFFGADRLRRAASFSSPKAEAPGRWPRWADGSLLQSFAGAGELEGDGAAPSPSPKARRAARLGTHQRRRCRMETCFDRSRCEQHGFKVFVYPREAGVPVSDAYLNILASIEESGYRTADAGAACLFVLGIDTLDRDRLSARYVPGVGEKLRASALWNGGRNHLIFTLYSGTWPDYAEELGFDSGQAMLARASARAETFRPGFDVSLPLFPAEHPRKGGEPGCLRQRALPPRKKYLLVFKGKRYLTGIGSGTRNALRRLHDGKDVVSLTSCRHGRGWQRRKDARCDRDHADYEKFDYQELLRNSTFCLIPRGRRLGSFRFLEALQAACVPVVLSDGWELPFSEVLDWGKAAVVASERLLLQVPSAVRRVGPERLLALQQQTQLLWDAYFSSVDKIVRTTLEIIRDRLSPHRSRARFFWNALPGGLLALPDFSTRPGDFPFYYLQQGSSPSDKFTALVRASCAGVPPSPPLLGLLQAVSASRHCAQILVLWSCETPPPRGQWPRSTVPVSVIPGGTEPSDRFFPYAEIRTDAVLSLDEHAGLSTSEVDFAFAAWRSFPERIVGFPARRHFWDAERQRWGCSAERSNELSIVLPAAAFYHSLFVRSVPAGPRGLLGGGGACEDVLLNLLVAAATKLPPVKVARRREPEQPGDQPPQDCLDRLAAWLGHMPLVPSQLRLDPVLFKDPVSILRKKYRRLETP